MGESKYKSQPLDLKPLDFKQAVKALLETKPLEKKTKKKKA
jgi:hypothetical protein